MEFGHFLIPNPTNAVGGFVHTQPTETAGRLGFPNSTNAVG